MLLHVALLEVGVVLGGEDDGVNVEGPVGGGVVGDGDLALGVGAQAQVAALADVRCSGP